MKVLVTGASGLVGGNIARALALRGDEVVALLRAGSKAPALDDLPHRRAEGDVRDAASVGRAVDGCEAVVHAAAVASMWARRADEMESVNVGGARNVLEAALAAGVRRAVHVSSIDALGLPPGGAPLGDDEPDTHPLMPGPYAASKRRADQVARELAGRGLAVCLVNPAYVFGPWDVKPSSGRMILVIARGVPVYPTHGGNAFVAASDVVAAVLAALEKGAPGRRYIVAPHSLSYKEAFTRIARMAGARPPWLPVPRAVALLAGALGSAAQMIARRELDVNLVVARSGAIARSVASTRAHDELGVVHAPFESGVEDALRWFREHRYLTA